MENSGKDVIKAQIQYIQIMRNFMFNQRDLSDYFILVQSYEEQLENDMKNIRQKLLEFLEQFEVKLKGIHLVEQSLDNLNHHKRDLQAYSQLLEINNFVNNLKKGVELLKFKISMRQYPDQVQQFYYAMYPTNDSIVEDRIRFLEKDYFICSGEYYDIEQIQFPQKPVPNLLGDQSSISEENLTEINLVQFSRDVIHDLKQFEDEIKIEDCPLQITQIQHLHLQYKQLFQLSEFKSNYSNESIEALQDFIEQSDQFVLDAHTINELILGFQINQEVIKKYKKLTELVIDPNVNKVFWSELQSNSDIQKMFNIWEDPNYDLPERSFRGFLQKYFEMFSQIQRFIELLQPSVQFFSLDKQYFQELQSSLNSLMSYIQKFKYSRDQLQKVIEYFERDINICQPEIKKQLLAKQCQEKLQNIDQKKYQYQQANELLFFKNSMINYDFIFKETTQSKYLFESIEKLEQYYQMFAISEKLYQVQVYPTHQNPEDQESVQAYDNLIEQQNLIVFLQNAFSKAEELLDFDIDIINSYEIQYQNLKKNINDKIYLQNYSERKINLQLQKLSKDQKLCSKDNKHHQIFLKDYSVIENYYWFEKRQRAKKPQKLLILPNNVDLFEREDITNYDRLTKACEADIQGLVEDIIETLKIIELLKYQKQGKNQYDMLLLRALSFEKDFLQQARKLFFEMENLKLSEKLRYFNIIKDQSIDKELQAQFKKLHIINDKIGINLQNQILKSFQNSKDLLKFNGQDFNRMNRYNKLVNDYLMKQKYQLKDKQIELLELYHEYRYCTGQQFLYDFCEFYKGQNIYGGICQQDCFYESKEINALQFDLQTIQTFKKYQNTFKLNGQKRKKNMKQNKSRSNQKKIK